MPQTNTTPGNSATAAPAGESSPSDLGWRGNFYKTAAPGLIMGMTLGDLTKLLAENGAQVPLRYWPKVAFAGTISLLTTPVGRIEDALLGRRVAEQRVEKPLFIIGHWRSGTTHLHNLMSVDRRFAYANFSQIMIPHTFLLGERLASAGSAAFLPAERMGVDHVAMNTHVPWEEEFALCQTTQMSPYMSWVFPRRADHYDRYVTFRDVPAADVERWKQAFVKLLKKLAWKNQRPLVLKSPPHTGRIKLILEMFPDARFVHIHRDPYVVYRSTVRLHQKCTELYSLQEPDDQAIHNRVVRQYADMFDAFFEEKSLIPAGQFCEVSYAALDADPIGTVGRIYGELSLPEFSGVEPDMRAYLDSLAGYEKNRHAELPCEVRSELSRQWRRSFEEWGYAL
jgi:hypothetical protein